MQELIKAVLEVMKEVKSIDKNLNVGTGGSSYKGVADKDVKLQIGQAMQKNGLVILPISVEPKTTVSEWDQESTYNNKTEMKHKTQVLTEVVTKYMLMHTSGESIEIAGYGHGVDSQDKSAGKATTYALKYALLNTFLVPTGDIDDTDSTHSDSYAQPPKQAQKKVLRKPIDTRIPEDIRNTDFASDRQTGLISKMIKNGQLDSKIANEIPSMTKQRASELISSVFGK